MGYRMPNWGTTSGTSHSRVLFCGSTQLPYQWSKHALLPEHASLWRIKKGEDPFPKRCLCEPLLHASLESGRFEILIPGDSGGVCVWNSFNRVRLFVTTWTTSPWILQARTLDWVTFPFSRGPSQPRDQTQVSHTAGRFFTGWATREAQEHWSGWPIPSPGHLPIRFCFHRHLSFCPIYGNIFFIYLIILETIYFKLPLYFYSWWGYLVSLICRNIFLMMVLLIYLERVCVCVFV